MDMMYLHTNHYINIIIPLDQGYNTITQTVDNHFSFGEKTEEDHPSGSASPPDGVVITGPVFRP